MATKKKTSKKKHPGGRPTVFDENKVKNMLDAVRMGSYIETAASYAGIAKSTLHEWLKKGARKQCPKCEQFSNDLQKAIAEAELHDIQVIYKASKGNPATGDKGDWKASAWRLERRNAKYWGRKEVVKTVDSDSTDFDTEEESLHKKLADMLED